MKQGKLIVAFMTLSAMFAGCDIFAVDNMDAPDSLLTGRVVFNGEPVGVRIPTNTAQILLWQADWDVDNPNRIEDDIPIYLNQNGEFSATLFDGEYEIEMINGAGPWQDDPAPRSRIVSVRGDTEFDIEVQPFYTIQNENITYNPEPGPSGSITATFKVGQHVTDPPVESVGVYVNTTTHVDRNRFTVRAEEDRSAIQAALDSNGNITVTVNLPANIRLTPSPDARKYVYVRVGVRMVGVAELAYSPVYQIEI